MNIYEKALESATLYHAGQTRKRTGLPYITHPMAVAEIAEKKVRKLYHDAFRRFEAAANDTDNNTVDAPEGLVNIVKAIAIYHDVWEDCKEKGAGREQTLHDFAAYGEDPETNRKTRELLGNEYIRNELEQFVDAVALLTKPEGEGVSYFDYLTKIKKSGLATIVKVSDIEHNLSDLPPGKLRDKYQLAHYYLSH